MAICFLIWCRANGSKQGTVQQVSSKKIDKASYQRFLSRSIHQVSDSKAVGLNIKDLNDPFFSGIFNTREVDIGQLKAKRSVEVNGRLNVLVENIFEKAFLWNIISNNHYIYFFSSPLTSEFTNLTNHATLWHDWPLKGYERCFWKSCQGRMF